MAEKKPRAGIDYDPELKEAMARIKHILEDHQVGAAITLVSKSHSEFLYHLPKWSCIAWTDRGLSIYSQERFHRSKEDQKRNQEESFHIVYQIRDIAAQTFMLFEKITRWMEKDLPVDIEHHSFANFTPHQDGMEGTGKK